MTTQELINRAELSDRVFNLLGPTYSLCVEEGLPQESQDTILVYLIAQLQEKGLISSEVAPDLLLKDFNNRL